MNSPYHQGETSETSWIKIVNKYNHPSPIKSWLQFSINLLLFSILWFLMFESLHLSYWITLGLSFPAAGMLVRLFIIYHDCGHGSFLKSRKQRDIIGILIGILTFTPYFSWSHSHNIHHETAGNLDKRGTGDVWTMTVDEYQQSTLWTKIQYRFYRNPITMFGVGPLYVFLIGNRFTKKGMDRNGRMGVYITNAGLAIFAISMSLLMGVKAYLLIQFPIIYFSGIFGFWLFYVQHQFENPYWERSEKWDYVSSALLGASYLKLPKLLNWISGSIGYHHIHHLSPLIPNYNLKKCHDENNMFRDIKPVTFFSAFESLLLRLWDEKRQMLIKFSEV